MDPSRPNASRDPSQRSSFGRIPPWAWWLVLLVLLAWNVFAFLPASRPEVTIPYSTFLDQVKTDNVSQVHIAGSEITGAFVKPVEWPQPSSADPASAAAQPTAQATSAAPTPPPQPYTRFVTTFPETIGDTSLMLLLEAHNVTVDVSPPPSPWLSLLLTTGLPVLFLIGFFLWMGRQAGQGQASIFNFGRTKARKYSQVQ